MMPRQCDIRNEERHRRLARYRAMSMFFFDLAGELPARDVVGHDCPSLLEAGQYAALVASRLALARPASVKPGNTIEVRDSKGAHFFSAPIQKHS